MFTFIPLAKLFLGGRNLLKGGNKDKDPDKGKNPPPPKKGDVYEPEGQSPPPATGTYTESDAEQIKAFRNQLSLDAMAEMNNAVDRVDLLSKALRVNTQTQFINIDKLADLNKVMIQSEYLDAVETINDTKDADLLSITRSLEDAGDTYAQAKAWEKIRDKHTNQSERQTLRQLEESWNLSGEELDRKIGQAKTELSQRIRHSKETVSHETKQALQKIEENLETSQAETRYQGAGALGDTRSQEATAEEQSQARLRELGLEDSSLARGERRRESNAVDRITGEVNRHLALQQRTADFGSSLAKATEQFRHRVLGEQEALGLKHLEADRLGEHRVIDQRYQHGTEDATLQAQQQRDITDQRRSQADTAYQRATTRGAQDRALAIQGANKALGRAARDRADSLREQSDAVFNAKRKADRDNTQKDLTATEDLIQQYVDALGAEGIGYYEAMQDPRIMQLTQKRDALTAKLNNPEYQIQQVSIPPTGGRPTTNTGTRPNQLGSPNAFPPLTVSPTR